MSPTLQRCTKSVKRTWTVPKPKCKIVSLLLQSFAINDQLTLVPQAPLSVIASSYYISLGPDADSWLGLLPWTGSSHCTRYSVLGSLTSGNLSCLHNIASFHCCSL